MAEIPARDPRKGGELPPRHEPEINPALPQPEIEPHPAMPDEAPELPAPDTIPPPGGGELPRPSAG